MRSVDIISLQTWAQVVVSNYTTKKFDSYKKNSVLHLKTKIVNLSMSKTYP